MISFILLAMLNPTQDLDEEARFTALVKQSNMCLRQEVERAVPSDKKKLSEEEKSSIRMKVVTVCDHFNDELAAYTLNYRDKKNTLAEMSMEMRLTSLRIANAMVIVRIEQNAENRN